MTFDCQTSAITDLTTLANCGSHGLIIVGLPGCGRKYVARQYANAVGASDFNLISPSMSEIRSMVDDANSTDSTVVYCVDEMDSGLVSVAYPLLKLIEDCPRNVYVTITCSNIERIPDTIISRCSVVTMPNPTKSDLAQYGVTKDQDLYDTLSKLPLWHSVKSFTDIDELYKLSPDKIKYFDQLIGDLGKSKVGVSNMVWRLQHFEDKSATPITLVIRHLMHINPTKSNLHVYLQCLNELQMNRMSVNAILCKMLFDLKYLG